MVHLADVQSNFPLWQLLSDSRSGYAVGKSKLLPASFTSRLVSLYDWPSRAIYAPNLCGIWIPWSDGSNRDGKFCDCYQCNSVGMHRFRSSLKKQSQGDSIETADDTGPHPVCLTRVKVLAVEAAQDAKYFWKKKETRKFLKVAVTRKKVKNKNYNLLKRACFCRWDDKKEEKDNFLNARQRSPVQNALTF